MKRTLLILALLNVGLINAQIENGMVAHFPFNGTYNDITSAAIVGTNVGCVFGPDRNSTPNQAIELNGNNYVTINNNAVKPNLPLTISTWIKLNSLNEMNIIICSDREYNKYWGYWLNVLPTTGQVGINFGSGLAGMTAGTRKTFISDMHLSTGVWYHVVAIINSYNDMSIYVDCNKTTGVYSGTGSTTMVYSNTESRIGSAPGNTAYPNGWFFNGSIDQLAIWNRALLPSEITYLCDTGNKLAVAELEKTPRELVKIVNVFGQEVQEAKNTPLIYMYSDGSTERIVITE